MLDEHHTTVVYPETHVRILNLSFQCASLLSLRIVSPLDSVPCTGSVSGF